MDELSMYLASTDESEDEEENGMDCDAKQQATREKFLSLLNSGNNSDSEKSEGDDKEGDMEITFNTDLEALGRKILEKKKSEETVWESVLRKKKEKKKAQKLSQSMQDDDDLYDDQNDHEGDDDDFFMEEPINEIIKEKTKHKGKGKKREKEKEEDIGAASQAELELLLAGDEDGKSEKRGYNMKRLKAKGRKEMDDVEEKLPDVDVAADPRFSALFNSHEFALDPTDPQYKRYYAILLLFCFLLLLDC